LDYNDFNIIIMFLLNIILNNLKEFEFSLLYRIYNLKKEEKYMAKWECTACGYIYDEAEEDTPFEDLPDDWLCPVCGVDNNGYPITT